MLPWTSFTCYTKDDQQGCSGLATDSPCGVWGRGWTTCLLPDSPLFAHISKWELVCKFGVIFHIFIISCLCSRFHVWNQWFFLLCNNLFIYQVLCTLIYRRRSLYSFLLSYTLIHCCIAGSDILSWLCFYLAHTILITRTFAHQVHCRGMCIIYFWLDRFSSNHGDDIFIEIWIQ